jgi:hypothetical protein
VSSIHPGAASASAQDNTLKPIDGLASPARGWAMLVIILGLIVAVLDGTIVNLALPGIARELNASPSQAIWVVNAYQIATLVCCFRWPRSAISWGTGACTSWAWRCSRCRRWPRPSPTRSAR